MDEKIDYNEPIKVGNNIWWIGFYDENTAFHCNPYVLVDGDEAVLFDPAGIHEYPKVASKLFSIVEPHQIKYIVLCHQDPDLCASVPLLEDVILNPDLKLVTHSRSSVLIKYYGVKSEFYNVDHHNYSLELSNGRILRFILAPFCHFPAAIMTYDEKEKCLFSGDLFGAISQEWHLFAKQGYETQMEAFHCGYIASNRHIRNVLTNLEKFRIDIIYPQHGSIIRDDMISNCINYLKNMNCGIDSNKNEEELYGWIPKKIEPFT